MKSEAPRQITSFLAHADGVTSASFSPDGQTLATGGYDCAVRLWNTQTWQEERVLPGHRRGHVAFSPDGTVLVSGGLHKNASVFETTTWQVKRTLYGTSGVWDLLFTPNGKRLAISQPDEDRDDPAHPIELRETTNWRIRRRLGIGVPYLYALAFHPDGKHAAVSTRGGLVSIWSVGFTRKLIEFLAHDLATWGLSYSPNGAMLASGGADNVARLWDTNTWNLTHELEHEDFEEVTTGHQFHNAVLCTAFSPDGKWLVTGGLDGVLTVWRLQEIVLG